MIKQKYGDRIDDWIHTAFAFLFIRPVNPNLLTLIGTLVSIAAAAAFASGWLIAGGLLILASGFFDLVDGAVARHQASSTRFGAFLDSTLDRFSDMAVLVGLATHFALVGRPDCVLLAGAALMATVLVSYSAACAKLWTPTGINVGIFERGERVVLLAGGAILGFPVLALWILTIGSSLTVGQRFAKAYREMGRLDAAESADRLRVNT